ncbi:MAG: hypothetical protein RR645_02370, partial [Clostridium sp.]
MSINNNFFQDEIFETENFEDSYYFPPVFSSSDDLASNDVFDNFKNNTLVDHGLEPGFSRLDVTDSLMGTGINPLTSQTQPTFDNPGYVQSYLKSQLGRFVRVEFLLGTNLLNDRTGTLIEVGINYIVLLTPSNDKTMCDLYSIKFVTTSTAIPPIPIPPV